MPEYPIQELAEDIAHSLTPQEFDDAAQMALQFVDTLNGEIIKQRGVKLACCEGCGVCCSLRIDVFAHEVFLIAHYIRSHFNADEIANLMVRLGTHFEKVMPLTPFEHVTQNIECPLLQNGRCTVYAVRPHSCRRHHSQDFATCQYTFDHPDDLESPAAHDRDLFKALTGAMQQNIDVYADLGFDHTIYELGTAVNEALKDAASWQRWRDHEQAFIHTSVTPTA
ncbi:MAG TPA: YkgJ family cysteine cluster protein [Chthoniobacter sp.]|jgi:Fe-S-cluster containining protein